MKPLQIIILVCMALIWGFLHTLSYPYISIFTFFLICIEFLLFYILTRILLEVFS